MDGVFSYNVAYVEDVFERLGSDGRHIYLIFHIFDCVFAFSYCLLMMAQIVHPFIVVTAWKFSTFAAVVYFFHPAAFTEVTVSGTAAGKETAFSVIPAAFA